LIAIDNQTSGAEPKQANVDEYIRHVRHILDEVTVRMRFFIIITGGKSSSTRVMLCSTNLSCIGRIDCAGGARTAALTYLFMAVVDGIPTLPKLALMIDYLIL